MKIVWYTLYIHLIYILKVENYILYTFLHLFPTFPFPKINFPTDCLVGGAQLMSWNHDLTFALSE